MRIGIPKEILVEEKRVAATPETVKKYVKMGFTVAIQAAAGDGIYVSDDDYRKAGATVVPSAEELFSISDVILKVKQPVFNATAQKHEAEMLREALSMFRYFLWVLGWDPARWQWFRRAYGGTWSLWWIGSPVNSRIWLDGLEEGERPGLGETCFKHERY